MLVDILIKNCTVITMNEQRQIIKNGFIAIKDDEIVQVGDHSELAGWQAVKIIEGHNHIALPGLIDTHAHAGHGLTKSLGEGGVEQGWDLMMEHIYYQSTTPQFWYAEALLSGLERLMFGVTTGVSMLGSSPRFDDLRYADAHVTGMREVGVRDFICVGTPNPPFPKRFRHWDNDKASGITELGYQESFAITRRLIKKYNSTGNGLTFALPGPSFLGQRKDLSIAENIEVNKTMNEIALEFNTQLHGHSYAGDIKFLKDNINILGPHIFTAHVTGISDEEIKIIADYGVNVCSGPSTSAFIRERCPVIKLMKAGANVAFCTDASAPDRNYDLLPKLRIGYRLHRSYYQNPKLLPPGKLLEMITVDAAKALGMSKEIGSLESGKKADVILINLERPHLYPIWMEPLRVVHQASGQDIDTVIVNGKLKVEDYQAIEIDKHRVLRLAQEEAEKMLVRSGFSHAAKLPKTNFWKSVSY